jgi:hypothetical protein
MNGMSAVTLVVVCWIEQITAIIAIMEGIELKDFTIVKVLYLESDCVPELLQHSVKFCQLFQRNWILLLLNITRSARTR